MKFWEALKAMEEGKKIAKDNGEAYYFIENNKLYICTGELMGEAFVSVTDMLDYNWELYDDRKPAPYILKTLADSLSNEYSDLCMVLSMEEQNQLIKVLFDLNMKYRIY